MDARLALAVADVYDVRVADVAGRLHIDGIAASVAQQRAAYAGVGPLSSVDLSLHVRPAPTDLRRATVLRARLAALAALGHHRAAAGRAPSTRHAWDRVVDAQYAGVLREVRALGRALEIPHAAATSACAPSARPPRAWPAQIEQALVQATALDAQIRALPSPQDPTTIPASTVRTITTLYVRTWEAMCP